MHIPRQIQAAQRRYCNTLSCNAAIEMSVDEYGAPGGVLSALEVVEVISCALPHIWLVPGHQLAHRLHGQSLSMGNLRVGHVAMFLYCCN